ncbi:hypothetical protein [Sphingobacterium multivorum]
MKKSILKMMLLGGVIFGFNHAQASTIAEEVPVAQMEAMVEQDGPVPCLLGVVIRGEQMQGHYPDDVLDRILEIEMQKCFEGTHSTQQ